MHTTKFTAYNIFANPILTPTLDEGRVRRYRHKDQKTVDRLYGSRNVGSRGLHNIVDIYISRKHINEMADTNPYLKLIQEYEEDGIIRVSGELIKIKRIHGTRWRHSKNARTKVCLKDLHEECWLKKKQHGYLFPTRKDVR